MLPDHIQTPIEPITGHILAVERLGGGCIAHASRLKAANGDFFLKWGDASVGASFPPEAAGLLALREHAVALKIPEVFFVDDRCLLLEWIEKGHKSELFFEKLGYGLAQLHAAEGPAYGLGEDNFIGRTPQENGWLTNWVDFFRDRRLLPQVRRARKAGLWQSRWEQGLHGLCLRLGELLPAEPVTSLLHGDLWGGNYLVGLEGEPVLIDPAVYYGHHEADLALTELFGGFEPSFYAAYHEVLPISDAYSERKTIYNLYHLINHLNLFGSSYAGGVEAILRRYV